MELLYGQREYFFEDQLVAQGTVIALTSCVGGWPG